jgi:hypothetical protein
MDDLQEATMTFELKTLSAEGVPGALEKAHRYRLLNEPGEAESICRDVLAIEADHQEALDTMLLALSDQFETAAAPPVAEARKVVERLSDPYARAYYAGIVDERRAKAEIRHDAPGCGQRAYESLRSAMAWYERAEGLRPPGNDDALLRWNACARLLMRDQHLVPAVEEHAEPLFLE